MKKLLICTLAIVMMLSSVAFANESIRINCGEFNQFSKSYFSITEENALEVVGNTNGNKSSTFEVIADPEEKYGDVVKLTIPSINGLEEVPTVFPYINSTFQDQVTESRKGTFNNISYGVSVFPVDNPETTNEIKLNINVKYITPGNTSNQTHVMCQLNSETLFDGSGKASYSKPFVGEWFDLRFDIDVENKISKVYVNGEFFCENQFASDIEYLRYININSSVIADKETENDEELEIPSDADAPEVAKYPDKVVYFDNFFVNETPKTLTNKTLKNVEYSTCILDDDFSETPIKKVNAFNANSGGGKAEKIDGVANFIFEGAVTTSVPSMASSSVSSRGTGDYLSGDYMFEIDLMFSNFNGESRLGYLKYNIEGDTSTDYNSHPAVLIENGGMLKAGGYNDYKPVTNLVKNTWYNFKILYKARNVSEDKNQGLLADVYFQDNLIAENIYITGEVSKQQNHTDLYVNTLRSINFQSGTATKSRVIYADNAKFYKVENIEHNTLAVSDLEVYNENGDLISTNYESGINTFKAYVTATTSQLSGKATLIAARYDLSNGNKLIGVDAVPVVATAKDDLTEITAQLNITEIDADERIKVMIVDAMDNLTPYIKPVILTPSVQ